MSDILIIGGLCTYMATHSREIAQSMLCRTWLGPKGDAVTLLKHAEDVLYLSCMQTGPCQPVEAVQCISVHLRAAFLERCVLVGEITYLDFSAHTNGTMSSWGSQ